MLQPFASNVRWVLFGQNRIVHDHVAGQIVAAAKEDQDGDESPEHLPVSVALGPVAGHVRLRLVTIFGDTIPVNVDRLTEIAPGEGKERKKGKERKESKKGKERRKRRTERKEGREREKRRNEGRRAGRKDGGRKGKGGKEGGKGGGREGRRKNKEGKEITTEGSRRRGR